MSEPPSLLPKMIWLKLQIMQAKPNIDHDLSSILEMYSHKNDFFFVQIGSFDGKSNDPIRYYILKYQWKGIFVEPLKEPFIQLTNNYHLLSNYIFENSIIANKNGRVEFYHPPPHIPNLPKWYQQVSTLMPKTLNQYKQYNIEKFAIKKSTPCLSYKQLLTKHKVKKVNLLHIDLEGYDYQLIKSINLNSHKPELIYFEHKQLSQKDKKSCYSLLSTKGYKVVESHENTLAYQPSNIYNKCP